MFCSQAAFDKLDSIYGTYTEKSDVKSNFQLPRHCMTNTDLNRIINSDEVRRLFRAAVGELGGSHVYKRFVIRFFL